MKAKRKFPPWLKRRIGSGDTFDSTQKTLSSLGLETICTNANCPNRGECWSRGTATVLILGNICTRNCPFCSVATGKPKPPDADEPRRVAAMAEEMKLKYLVITSVDRDDLSDGGASHFRDVVSCCRTRMPHLQFELLVPDFRDCQVYSGLISQLLDQNQERDICVTWRLFKPKPFVSESLHV